MVVANIAILISLFGDLIISVSNNENKGTKRQVRS
jgi:hypothetical protein